MAEENNDFDGPAKNELAAGAPAVKTLPPAAQRALAEAEARRKSADVEGVALEKERGGRKEGPEPTRYGDWENKGILSDF